MEADGKRYVIIRDDKYKRARLASDDSSTPAADSSQQPGVPGATGPGKKQPSLQFHGSAECISQGPPPGVLTLNDCKPEYAHGYQCVFGGGGPALL